MLPVLHWVFTWGPPVQFPSKGCRQDKGVLGIAQMFMRKLAQVYGTCEFKLHCCCVEMFVTWLTVTSRCRDESCMAFRQISIVRTVRNKVHAAAEDVSFSVRTPSNQAVMGTVVVGLCDG
jgi:hypothetical protein